MSSKDKLIALINAENPAPFEFTNTNITFGTPIVEIGPDWNTMIVVTAVRGSGYRGSVEVYYRRINLQEKLGPMVQFLSETPFTVEDVINKINVDHCSEFLDSEDLMPVAVPEMEIGEVTHLIFKALPDALGVTDEVVIEVAYGLPLNTNELHYLLHTTLPSDNYLLY